MQVVAPAAGIINEAGYDGDWGNKIIIDYGDDSYGRLAHLDSISVSVGQYVAQGQIIGTCGGTGGCSPHIHYQTEDSEGYSEPSSFTDVSTNGGVPVGCDCTSDDGNYRYTSGNYFTTVLESVFADEKAEGWSAITDTQHVQSTTDDTWLVNVVGSNPGVESPEVVGTAQAQDLIVQFRVKITGISSCADGTLYVKDETGSWNNPVDIDDVIADGSYYEYTVCLSGITNNTRQVKQFSLELTDSAGGGGNEYWEFDWVKLIYTGDSGLANVQEARNTAVVSDINGNNIDEIAVLRVHPDTHQSVVSIIDSGTGDRLTEIYYSYVDGEAYDLMVVDDRNSNDAEEIMVITNYHGSADPHIEVRDAKTGLLVE